MEKGKGGTAWETLLCWLSPPTAKRGSQLQAGAGGVATVQIFQKEKPLDYKSFLERSLHAGLQQHPPKHSADLWKELLLCVAHAGRYLTHSSGWWGEGRVKQYSPFLPHLRESLAPRQNQISTANRTNSSNFYSHQVTEETRGSLGWQNFLTLSFCYVQGGIYRKRISNDESKCYCLSSALCSVTFQIGMRGSLEPGGKPWLLAPQGSCPRGQPCRLAGDCSGKIPVMLKKSIHSDRLLCWLDCVQRNGRDYSESGFKWGSFLVWSRHAFFWCHLTF